MKLSQPAEAYAPAGAGAGVEDAVFAARRPAARQCPRCARDAALRRDAHLRELRPLERAPVPRLARLSGGRAAHAVRCILTLFLQSGVGAVRGAATRDRVFAASQVRV